GPGFEPAAGSMPATECERVGFAPEEARVMAERQSVAFANYLADLANQPDIGVELHAVGNASPVQAYPPSREGLTAGEWNRIAAKNNRVEVRLIPDAVTASTGAL